jgi:hypothetical protein
VAFRPSRQQRERVHGRAAAVPRSHSD